MEINLDLSIPKPFNELFNPCRYKVYYGGRGGAKSWAFADALLLKAIREPSRVLCARELQVSIADSVHRLLCDRIESLGLSAFYQIQAKTITGLNGSEFLFKGLRHNATEIKSTEGIDVCWVEEAEKVSQASWELLIPTVRKEGSEIWVSFNPKNATDPTYKRFVMDPPPSSMVRKVSYKDNPFFPAVLESERLDLLRRDPEAYRHVWEGDFDTRYSGAIYAKWIADLQHSDRISDRVLHDPAYPVFTVWDLGYGDTCVQWFYQASRSEVLIIDYYEDNGEGIKPYCDNLKAKPYTYGAHYVPQDAGRKLMEANGRSIVEQAWKDHGVRMSIIPETTHSNRHAGLRKVLPSCWINSDTCKLGLEALMAYHFDYDENLQRFKKDPVHDWSSHASTALELLPSAWHGKSVTTEELASKKLRAEFHRRRRETNLDKDADPYRVKPMRKS